MRSRSTRSADWKLKRAVILNVLSWLLKYLEQLKTYLSESSSINYSESAILLTVALLVS